MKEKKEWRGGVFLCTTKTSFEADLLESKLRSEGISCIKKYKGASNFLEIAAGNNVLSEIDLYVREELLEDAQNIIVAVPLDECEPVDYEDDETDERG